MNFKLFIAYLLGFMGSCYILFLAYIYIIRGPIYFDEGIIKCSHSRIGSEYFVEEIEKNILVVDREMLEGIISENGDYENVCTSNIVDMGGYYDPLLERLSYDYEGLFTNREVIHDITRWDVSNVSNFMFMFSGSNFNQDISNWDMSNARDLGLMFFNTPFNQPIGNWDVSKTLGMSLMFAESNFNQPIGNWDVSKVRQMIEMFKSSQFNQPIGNWDVSNVDYISNMFRESPFNQDISNWDVSNAIDLSGILYKTPFNKDLTKWENENLSDIKILFQRNDKSLADQEYNHPIAIKIRMLE